MIFSTLNSTYEIDGSRIRRLEGVNEPTPRQGQDGEWREFKTISAVEVGLPVLIIWCFVNEKAQGTHTSEVVSITQRH